MRLVLFDIDGTLIESCAREDQCFAQALRQHCQITQYSQNWEDYPHVTDKGILTTILAQHYASPLCETIFETLKKSIIEDLHSKLTSHSIVPIKGVHHFLHLLQAKTDIALGVATGSFYQSACLKLKCAGLPHLIQSPFASGEDLSSRLDICQQAYQKACQYYGVLSFKQVIYVGDGPWDFKCAQEMGAHFIGIGTTFKVSYRVDTPFPYFKDFSQPWRILDTIDAL